MALTSRDETDLIIPLFGAGAERPPFSTFLERLRRRTEADHVGILIRSGEPAPGGLCAYWGGPDPRSRARGSDGPDPFDHIHFASLRADRVYSTAEFFDAGPAHAAHRERSIREFGIADERVVRLSIPEGVGAWLVLARARPCTGADSALLSNLAPYVALALRDMIRLDQHAIETAMNAQGLARSGAGWILFDREGRVLASEPATREALSSGAGAALRAGERLSEFGMAAERQVTALAAEFSQNPEAEPRSLVLQEAPRIELLLLGLASPAGVLTKPAMLALCRLPRSRSGSRAETLAALFDLPPREAELALALSDGLSLAEAADAMGLTLETVRNYSKRLYAKLHVRSQAELVRAVYESSAILA